jgi:hypothetical protein
MRWEFRRSCIEQKFIKEESTKKEQFEASLYDGAVVGEGTEQKKLLKVI